MTARAFQSGHIVSTPGALEALRKAGQTPLEFLTRHMKADWGDMTEDDKRANGEAVRRGDERIFSAYPLKTGGKIWIITEADRSSTTILLPDEY